jgi:hypothetical protein
MRTRAAQFSILATVLAVAAGLPSTSCGGRVLATEDAGSSRAPQGMSGGASSPGAPSGSGGYGYDGSAGGGMPPYYDGGSALLYDRLGRHAGITMLVKDAFENASGGILTDPQLASYFYIRTGGYAVPGGDSAGGAPSLDVVEACFTDLLSNAAGGPEQYPTDEQGFTCRDMRSAHAGLGITAYAFQRFVSLLASRFVMDGVSSDDLMTLGAAILGTQTDIIDASRVHRQMEAGVDATADYGAYCGAIDGGANGCSPYE